MTRSTAEIAYDISSFVPRDGNWLALDQLLTELWQSGNPQQAIPQLLSVFERYPEEDGFGVVWSVLHGLESLKGYESELLWSLARKPSEFGIRMVGRLLNSGIAEANGVSLEGVLRSIATSANSVRIREEASGFLAKVN